MRVAAADWPVYKLYICGGPFGGPIGGPIGGPKYLVRLVFVQWQQPSCRSAASLVWIVVEGGRVTVSFKFWYFRPT